MTELERVSAETMRFMRGKYALDEISNDKDELAFRDGDQTLLTIRIHKKHYDFQIGPHSVQVTDLECLEEAKRLILVRKKPNRKPLPKENAVYADCGHRCDLCIHYSGSTEEYRARLREHHARVYGGSWTDLPLCAGCSHGGLSGKHDCDQKKCVQGKGVTRCLDCAEHDCGKATAGWPPAIEPKSVSADDVTWAILPYVSGQYGN